MSIKIKKVMNNWKEVSKSKFKLLELFVSFFVLVITMLIFSRFMEFVEVRKGVQFHDPILDTFIAIDLTRFIFSLIYGGILLALFYLVSLPLRLIILFEAYALMVIIRIVMMFVLPLAPPLGMIILKDPFVELFGTGKTLLNDLFFSGHVATLSLLTIVVPKKIKWHFVFVTLLVAASVLLQKAHYTVDVLVAPFISFTSYFVVLSFFNYRYKNNKTLAEIDSARID